MISDSGISALPLELTSFVGRVRELGAVRALIQRQDVRLVTLTGPGGVGKTRLALHVATTFGNTFPDGVRFIPLATVNDPAAVLPRIVQALDVAEIIGQSLIDRVADMLRDRQLLLALDNFEQILDAAPLIGTLLAACPMLRILITSRAPLHISGEHEFPVSPLALPDSVSPLDANTLMQYPATRLFIERARAVNPDFAVTADTAPDVAGICARLDGLPLAIELAAARVKVLTPSALLTRLDHSLTVLTGGMRDAPLRQQTLRATIEWSYALLGPGEQILFNRMAAFVGGGTLHAIAMICNSEGDLPFAVLDGITSLVDKSVVQRSEESGGDPRFGMLETIREYALERLVERGEQETIARAHAVHYRALAEEAEPHLIGPQQSRWLRHLQVEHDNLRAALGWAVANHEAETAMRLGSALQRYWQVRGHVKEGCRWLEAILEQTIGAPTSLRAKAYIAAANLTRLLGDYGRARSFFEESLAISRTVGDQPGVADSLRGLGMVAEQQGDYVSAQRLLEDGLTIYRTLVDNPGIALTLNNLGLVAHYQSNYRAALAFFEESLSIRNKTGNKQDSANVLNNLGMVAQDQRDYAAARSYFMQSLAIHWKFGDTAAIADPLEGLAEAAGLSGDGVRAARLLGAAETLRRTLSVPLAPADHIRHERNKAHGRALLGLGAWAAAWAEGCAMPLEQVIAEALTAQVGPPAGASAYPAGLSSREVEVLRLVAAGHTNRQIANALSLSPRTIEVHVRNIFAKTGTDNRAGATAFAFRHTLA